MFSLQPKNTFLFPLDILPWARLCSGWNYFQVSVAMRQRRSSHTGTFPWGCNSFSQREKKNGKMHFSFPGRWYFVSRRIYSSSYLLLRCAFTTQKRGVLWFLERIQVWAMANLARAPGKFSHCIFWVSSVSCLGTSATKKQSVFPEGQESATWLLLVSWSTGCL